MTGSSFLPSSCSVARWRDRLPARAATASPQINRRNAAGQCRLFDVLRVGQNTAAATLTIDLLPWFHRRRSSAADATRRESRTPSPNLSTSPHPQLATGETQCDNKMRP
uniref:Uncharacterized protein n=1 Tax=Oryza glumipatula TaxID=40148 RepID=A0A0D9Y7E8_9ORYZ